MSRPSLLLASILSLLALTACETTSHKYAPPTAEMVFKANFPEPVGYVSVDELSKRPKVLNEKEVEEGMEINYYVELVGQMFFGSNTYILEVRFLVNDQGTVDDVQILEANCPVGHREARGFLKTYRFEKGVKDGKYVPYYFDQTITNTIHLQ